ncbi:MAG: beta-ketoacyl reductase, partial [Pseudomonadota bacterium]|nr:beta-ketoacyl reductase [Pseudomonadota bacterium]
YGVDWQPKERAAAQPPEPGRWLIFADTGGVGNGLAARWRARGDAVVLVRAGSGYGREADAILDPAAPGDFHRLLREVGGGGRLRGVVHLWSLDEPEATADSRIPGCASVLHLVQALARQAHPPRLWLVTRNAQAVGGAPLAVQQAPVWGLGRVIALEHPDLRCVRLDMESGDGRDIEALFDEINAPDGEDQIAWRQGVRYVARLVRLARPAMGRVAIRPDAAYLITGGLGALGLEAARWLAAEGARHLVLLGRRDPGDARPALDALAQAGVQVLTVKADVACPESLASALAIADLPPLRGVVHAAGVLDDGVLVQQTWERFRRVLAPKVQGAWNLHNLTSHLPLDFFVCFSSVTAVFGAPAQGSYAAANAFMDALAAYRRGLGLPALSINWGPWAAAGMAAELAGRDQRRIDDLGWGRIDPQDGRRLLGVLPGQPLAQVAVLAVDWRRFLNQMSPDIPPFFEGFAQSPAQPAGWLEDLRAAAPGQRRALLAARVRGEIAGVLELAAAEQIRPRQGLFELGIDSLMAVELRNRLGARLGRSLRSTLVFDYPTLEALVGHLLDELGLDGTAEALREPPAGVVEALSEAEAEALLLERLAKVHG